VLLTGNASHHRERKQIDTYAVPHEIASARCPADQAGENETYAQHRRRDDSTSTQVDPGRSVVRACPRAIRTRRTSSPCASYELVSVVSTRTPNACG
jgi:hypothetical protein